jgi:3'-5' exoribonuclease
MGTRLSDLRAGEALDSFFLVVSSREGTTRNGSTYLTIELRDATGTRTAKVWRPSEATTQPFDVPGIYRVAGRTDTYRDELQVAVDRLVPYRPTDDEMAELTTTSRWPAQTLVDELRDHIRGQVRSDILRAFLLFVLDHPEVAPRLGTAPAATHNHHAFRSGLVEHSLSMMRIASVLAAHYEAYYPGLVNGDLLVAGCLLHDLGKVWELGGELAADYTDAGRLVGHIPMGAAFIDRAAREHGAIPPELVLELQHLVLSHHGQLEFGSPIRPKNVEAQILHQIDMLDSRVNAFAQITADGWTPFHRMFGHAVRTGASHRSSWEASAQDRTHSRGPGLPAVATEPAPTAEAPEDPAAAPPVRRAKRAARAVTPAITEETGDETEAADERPPPVAPVAVPEDGPVMEVDPRQPSLFDGLD